MKSGGDSRMLTQTDPKLGFGLSMEPSIAPLESRPLKFGECIRETRIDLQEINNVVCKLHLYKLIKVMSC
jgi:hypothetical protein